MKKMIDVISGKEDIKVKNLDTSTITADNQVMFNVGAANNNFIVQEDKIFMLTEGGDVNMLGATAYIPRIKVNAAGYDALIYDGINNELNIGAYDFVHTYIYGADISLGTEDYGNVYLNDEGFVIDTSGVNITLGGLKLANYTTALRPTSMSEGSIIYDSTLKKCILYNGTAWVNLDGTALA